MYKHLLFYLFLAAAIFLAACQKNTDSDFGDKLLNPNERLLLTGYDTMLVFQDSAEFTDAIFSIINTDVPTLDDFEVNHNFFSMRRYYDSLQTYWIDGDTIPYDWMLDSIPVEDYYFATMLNPNGYIQVGETIYHITRDTVYLYDEDHVLINAYDISDNSGESQGFTTMSHGGCHHFSTPRCWSNYTATARVHGRLWNHWWGLYASTGASTSHEERRTVWRPWGGSRQVWRNTNINRVAVDPHHFEYKFAWNFGGGCGLDRNRLEKSHTNRAVVQSVVAAGTFDDDPPFIGYPVCVCSGGATHRVQDGNGNTLQTCTTGF